jgi:hypothetical protein
MTIKSYIRLSETVLFRAPNCYGFYTYGSVTNQCTNCAVGKQCELKVIPESRNEEDPKDFVQSSS